MTAPSSAVAEAMAGQAVAALYYIKTCAVLLKIGRKFKGVIL